MWWLIRSGRGPGFESGSSHNDPDALQDHCDKVENLRVERKAYPWGKKRSRKKYFMGVMKIYSKVSFMIPWERKDVRIDFLPDSEGVLNKEVLVGFPTWFWGCLK